MIRRDFVKRTLGAGLVSSLVASTSASTARAAAPTAKRLDSNRRKPRIMYFNDSRHDLVYHYEPPMSKRQFEAPVDELVGTSVEAVCLGLGDGRTVFHDTKVSEVWGDPVDRWSHAVFHRAGQNVRGALDQGVDPLRVCCERAHAKGMLLYPTLLLNQGQRGSSIEEDVRTSKYRLENRHLEIGAKGDLPNFPGKSNLDFKLEAVRSDRFALIEEVIRNYPIDGFELQLNYISPGPYFFHPNEVAAGRPLMTAWLKKVYESLKASDPNRELVLRVPNDIDQGFSLGLDYREWIRQGIVDVLVGETHWGRIDTMADFRPLVEAVKGSDCRAFAAINSIVSSDRLLSATIEMTRATACNYWQQGVDGLYLAQWFAGANWPYRADFYAQLREIDHPDIMAPQDKFYTVMPLGDYGGTRGVPPSEPQPKLPVELKPGQTAKIDVTIADDLMHWDREGVVREVLLRLRIGVNERERVTISLNGKTLPDSSLKKINQMYKMFAPCKRIGGYWFVYKLDRQYWPRQGSNLLEVTLTHRDPDLATGHVRLGDVELETKYLISRNFWADDDPDVGPYEKTGRNSRR